MGVYIRPVRPAIAAGWRRQLAAPGAAARARALLHLRLGEYLLGQQKQPVLALEQFQQAEALSRGAAPLYDLPVYDAAVARYYIGQYRVCTAQFTHLLRSGGRHGFSSRICALWARHASACAGSHAARAQLGVPERDRLDPMCGVPSLAA